MGFRSFKLPKERVGIFQSQLHSHPASGYRDTSAAIEKNRFRATKRNVAVRLVVVKTLNVYLVAVISEPSVVEGGRFRGQDSSSITTCNHIAVQIREKRFLPKNPSKIDKLSLTFFGELAGKGRRAR